MVQLSSVGALGAMSVILAKYYAFHATIVVTVKDNRDIDRKCRVVLDSEPQLNFISIKLTNIIQLPWQRV